jgi:hypothetical protein
MYYNATINTIIVPDCLKGVIIRGTSATIVIFFFPKGIDFKPIRRDHENAASIRLQSWFTVLLYMGHVYPTNVHFDSGSNAWIADPIPVHFDYPVNVFICTTTPSKLQVRLPFLKGGPSKFVLPLRVPPQEWEWDPSTMPR